MTKPQLLGVFLAAFTLPVDAQHDELWDRYPDEVVFRTVNGTASDQQTNQAWRASSLSAAAFTGMPLTAIINDADARVTISGVAMPIDTDLKWQWVEVARRSEQVYGCRFEYRQLLGALMQAHDEGYRIGQRESLAWTGASGACSEIVAWYIGRARQSPPIAFHLASWPTSHLNFVAEDTGLFELTVIHNAVKTRRLLRVEDLSQFGADPANLALGSIGSPSHRFDSIRQRLQADVFRDRFEETP